MRILVAITIFLCLLPVEAAVTGTPPPGRAIGKHAIAGPFLSGNRIAWYEGNELCALVAVRDATTLRRHDLGHRVCFENPPELFAYGAGRALWFEAGSGCGSHCSEDLFLLGPRGHVSRAPEIGSAPYEDDSDYGDYTTDGYDQGPRISAVAGDAAYLAYAVIFRTVDPADASCECHLVISEWRLWTFTSGGWTLRPVSFPVAAIALNGRVAGLVGAVDGRVEVRHIPSWSLDLRLDVKGAKRVAVSPFHVAVETEDGTVKLFDRDNGQLVNQVAFAAPGPIALSDDALVVSLREGLAVIGMDGRRSTIRTAEAYPTAAIEGRRLAWLDDGTIRLLALRP